MTGAVPQRGTSAPEACSPGTSIYAEILEFLYREAGLLDDGEFAAWIKLCAEDIHYVMPVRTTQFRARGAGFEEVSFFDENINSLRTRVARLQTESAWAETPPSRTRHFLTNVLVKAADQREEFAVTANFLVTRTRADQAYQMFTGRREDLLRRVAASDYRIARRRILIDQTVITSTNLSVFF
jgi:3-phenylpropionate/cinnamic acid dioxygenase small subunit